MNLEVFDNYVDVFLITNERDSMINNNRQTYCEEEEEEEEEATRESDDRKLSNG